MKIEKMKMNKEDRQLIELLKEVQILNDLTVECLKIDDFKSKEILPLFEKMTNQCELLKKLYNWLDI